jgi:hypothetical protein
LVINNKNKNKNKNYGKENKKEIILSKNVYGS